MNKSKIKITGATFTPQPLADFLASKILESIKSYDGVLSVLDPACGDGSLLSAISKRLQDNNQQHSVAGYDTDINYLSVAKDNIKSTSSIEFRHEDFLLSEVAKKDVVNLFYDENTKSTSKFDVVIANPPYVRTQNLGADRSKEIAKLFGLKGKIDLYFPFLISMTHALKDGGIIGVITSNRYLTTKSGEQIRKYITENYEILEIIDLGDTKLFDAAVLPAILIGRKKKHNHASKTPGQFAKIYEASESHSSTINADTIFEILKSKQPGTYSVQDKLYSYNCGKFRSGNKPTDIWQLTDCQENEWVSNIQQNTSFYIGDVFKVRVGIKSCADKIFIRQNWDSETDIPEDLMFKTLLSQETIGRWCGSTDVELYPVLYPHYSENGKRQVYNIDLYPKAKRYFEKNYEVLSARKYLIDGGRKWYELWVPQNPDLWQYPKLVFPDISTTPRFHYDNKGFIVNGNCYWIVAQTKEEEELLLLIQGVANSDVLTKYHDLCFNNKLYSGRRRYLSQYIQKYPVPDPNSASAKEIVKLVRKLNSLSLEKSDLGKLENKLNRAVANAFNIQD